MEPTVLDLLETAIIGQKEDIRNRVASRMAAKTLVMHLQAELKKAKTHFNQTTKSWIASRKMLIRLKSKKGRLPRIRRKWGKEHLGVVLNKIMKEGDLDDRRPNRAAGSGKSIDSFWDAL